MNTHTNDNAVKSLPVFQILKSSFRLPFENAALILRLGWPYLLVSMAITVLSVTNENGFLNFFSFLLMIAASVLAGVACHRIFLCPKDEVTQLSTFRWGKSEADFFVAGLKLTFALIVGTILAVGLGALVTNIANIELPTTEYLGFNLLVWAGIFVFGYVFSRISFILPGAAVGRYFNFNTSWAATKPYALPLYFVIFLVPMALTTIVTTLLSVLEGSALTPLGYELLIALVSLVGAVIELCILSKSFEWVTNQMPEERAELEVDEQGTNPA